MNHAAWTDGKRTVRGYWRWNFSKQRFVIHIDGNDDLGRRREPFEVSGDAPEFGRFKLVEGTQDRTLDRYGVYEDGRA